MDKQCDEKLGIGRCEICERDRKMFTPRRPLDDHRPDLYLESDADYFSNNRELILKLLEPFEQNESLTQRS